MATFKVECSVPDESKHIGDVECIAFHGDKIYTGAGDGMIKVWTLDLKQVSEIQAHQVSVYHLAINNDGTILYSCSNDGSIRSWKLPSMEEGPQLNAHMEAVRKIRVLPNGTLATGDEVGIVCLWPNAAAPPRKLDFMGEEIWDLQVDGEFIYTARDRDVVVSIVKENIKSVINKATLMGRAPMSLVKDKIYFISREGTDIIVHYTAEKKYEKITELKGHELIINALGSSKSGTYLYSGGYDNSIRIWDTEKDEHLCEIPLDTYVNCVCSGPDDNTFYVGGANSMIVKIVKQ